MTVATRIAGALLACALVTAGTIPLRAAETENPPRQSWSFYGAFGKFDRGQLQRGLKVYREVCATCHGMTLVSFRNLSEPGGPEFSQAQAQAIAAEYKIKDGPNDQGEMFERPGRIGDRFPAPFANEQAARAQYGAAPPDLSVIAKARGYERGFPKFLLDIAIQYQEHGVDYITALLQGYEEPPKDFTLPSGLNYNKYFPGHAIAMPPPLADGRVEYTDGTPNTLAQQSKDVAAFLMWAAEPHLEARKKLGFEVMVFLILLAGLMYYTKHRVWHEAEAPAEAARGADPKTTTT